MTEVTEDTKAAYAAALRRYREIQGRGLHLNMSRGKPSPMQLDLSMDMLRQPLRTVTEDGTDARNYGVMEGVPECRRLFGELLGINPDQITLGGNSSLNMMFDMMSFLHLFGTQGQISWSTYRCRGRAVKFLCPVPGYDRHFRICQALGVEMIPIPLLEDGPDMELAAKLAGSDPDIKGIWCVPLHSNPEGVCYSDRTVRALAGMKTAASDFRIFWDNAYAVHHIYERVEVKNILDECARQGHPDRPYYFFSTSKVTFPGAGVAMVASSPANTAEIRKYMSAQTIGHDKLNQLRHVQFFENADGLRRHMDAMAGLLRPKFDIVLRMLESRLKDTHLASWSHPRGGYFVSLHTLPGCASRTVELAAGAGVALTEAGATYPYGNDPLDSNIRIAPSYPDEQELRTAMEVLILCIKIASYEKILEGEKENGKSI